MVGPVSSTTLTSTAWRRLSNEDAWRRSLTDLRSEMLSQQQWISPGSRVLRGRVRGALPHFCCVRARHSRARIGMAAMPCLGEGRKRLNAAHAGYGEKTERQRPLRNESKHFWWRALFESAGGELSLRFTARRSRLLRR